MKLETIYSKLYRQYQTLERYYKISGLELEGVQRGHFVRQAGNVLVPRSTVYLVLHFMDLMNRSSYKKLVGHVGMFPIMRNNQLFEEGTEEFFLPGRSV